MVSLAPALHIHIPPQICLNTAQFASHVSHIGFYILYTGEFFLFFTQAMESVFKSTWLKKEKYVLEWRYVQLVWLIQINNLKLIHAEPLLDFLFFCIFVKFTFNVCQEQLLDILQLKRSVPSRRILRMFLLWDTFLNHAVLWCISTKSQNVLWCLY